MTEGRNAELWREWTARIGAGDSAGATEFLDPDHRHHMRADEPEARTLESAAEWKALIDTWRETFPDLRIEIHELIEHGDRVIAVTTLHGRGAGSGAEVHEPYVFVTTFRDERAVETYEYATKEEALASLE